MKRERERADSRPQRAKYWYFRGIVVLRVDPESLDAVDEWKKVQERERERERVRVFVCFT